MNQQVPLTPAHQANAMHDIASEPLSAEEFAALDDILNDLRTRHDAVPSWEFCEGFMAALICCRRQMTPDEYLPVLLVVPFANAVQRLHFLALWARRWNQVMQALNHKITALDDASAYQPEVQDARAVYAALADEGRAAMVGHKIPSFGQLWAGGFMAAVAAWPKEWAVSHNKEAIKWRTAALDHVAALTQDDNDVPTLSAFEDSKGIPTVSTRRMKAFGDAIWAVYNMREMWRSLGPRIETVHKVATPGRNDPCACGSGKKYKRCCGLL